MASTTMTTTRRTDSAFLRLPVETQIQVVSLLADSTDFKYVHSLLYTCRHLYHIALPFSVQTFSDIPRYQVVRSSSPIRSRIVQFLSYVSIVKPELAQYVRAIKLHSWLTKDNFGEKVQIDASDRDIFNKLILKAFPEQTRYHKIVSSALISELEAGIEDAAVALLLIVCPKVKILTFGQPWNPNNFFRILKDSWGWDGIYGWRIAKQPPSQLLTELEYVKHESSDFEEGYLKFHDHASHLFLIPSIRSYECVGAKNLERDYYYVDPIDEGLSNIQSIILRDSWCSDEVILSLVGACRALKEFTYTCGPNQTHEDEATARDILTPLLSHAETLEYLHVDLIEGLRESPWASEPRERLYMGVELRQMHKLKSLKIGSQNISGLLGDGRVSGDTGIATPEAPKVIECVPEHLEILEIHSCGRNIISQLEEFLNALICPDRFPNLSTVNFVFNEKWVEEEELKSLISNRHGLDLGVIRR